MTTTEVHNAVPVTFRATIVTSENAPTLLPMEKVEDSLLQLEIEKQSHHLNRMAHIRHTTAAMGASSFHPPNRSARASARSSTRSHAKFNDASGGGSSSAAAAAAAASTRTFQGNGEWIKLTSVKANDLHQVTKYRSAHTGLTVVHAKVKSPEVHGTFVVRHRVSNHLGLPHILQHLVFLGSTSLPYPGLLDQLAVKCFSPGTEAYIDSDHSSYSLKAAGKDGFLSLLPIYLDHIFFPALTEEGYASEVYHPGEAAATAAAGEEEEEEARNWGAEGGVCYLEMKEVEKDPLEKAKWALCSEIYPPSSGYYYNYGGHAEEMKGSCSLEKVRRFHAEFYAPSNSAMIVCGDLEVEEVFRVLSSFVGRMGGGGGAATIDNPWRSEEFIEIKEEIERELEYPSESEGKCLVKVAMFGASSVQDVTLATGMDILIHYLVHGAISPIQQEFVQGERGIAGHVHLSTFPHIQTVYCFNFENVEEDKRREVPVRLRELFERQFESEFNAERMEYMVSHFRQEEMSAMENEAERAITQAAISDFLYGFDDNPLQFDRRINNCYTVEQFSNQPPTFWLKLLAMLISSNWATVYVVPVVEAAAAHPRDGDSDEDTNLERLLDANNQTVIRIISTEEKGRSRKKKGMEAAGAASLEAAPASSQSSIHSKKQQSRKKLEKKKKQQNEIHTAPPPELYELVQTPAIDSIGFLGIERHANPAWASDTICNLYLDDINANYVYLTVLMDTSELTLEEKKYLVLFAEAILEAPYVDNSQRAYSYEEMISGLSADVLKYETFFGLDWDEARGGTRFSSGCYSHLFCIRFQMEMKKVKEGFEWMQILLWNTKWSPERLKIIAARLAADVGRLLDHGGVMAAAMLADSLYQMNSNVKAMSLVRQQVFLEKIGRELPKSFKRVAKHLETIRMVCLRPENTTVHVATKLSKMDFYLTDKPEIRDAIAQLLRRTFDYSGWVWGYQTKRLSNHPEYKWMKGVPCIERCVTEQILRMHSAEGGASLIQVAPSIRNYNSPEMPGALVAMHYFCQNEGPFFKEIKAPGFVQHYAMRLKPEEGMMYFEISGKASRALDLVAAYTKVFEIIHKHTEIKEGEEAAVWSPLLLQSAKSSAIFELIEKENSPKTLALNSLIYYHHKVPGDFNRSLMQRVNNVKLPEVVAIAKKYFYPLFIKTSTCAVAAPVDHVPEIIKGLMEYGSGSGDFK